MHAICSAHRSIFIRFRYPYFPIRTCTRSCIREISIQRAPHEPIAISKAVKKRLNQMRVRVLVPVPVRSMCVCEFNARIYIHTVNGVQQQV